MNPTIFVLQSVVIPLGTCAGLLMLCFLVRLFLNESIQLSRAETALSVFGAYLISSTAIFGGPDFPPSEASQWVPYLLLGTVLFDPLYARTKNTFLRTHMSGLVYMLATLVVIFPLYSYAKPYPFFFGLGFTVLGSFFGTWGYDQLIQSKKKVNCVVLPAIFSFAIVISLALSGSFLLCQLMTALMFSSMIPLFFSASPEIDWIGVPAPLHTVFMPILCMLVIGHVYSELSLISYVLFLLGPFMMAWVYRLSSSSSGKPADLMRTATTAIIMGLAAMLATTTL